MIKTDELENLVGRKADQIMYIMTLMENLKYQLTVGLEVHIELFTKTKMFCRCLNDPNEKRPNINICPVCTAQPGALPVINKEAVKQVLRVGTAIGAKLADFTEFDRKNYFYPDIPKGYQISQYEYPLVAGGILNDVAITRVHLEEDTAKSWHDDKTGKSFVDFNRSSLPLMELVTEAVIHDAKTAANFARELQLLMRYLGASEANMEQGQMRVEANISVSKDPSKLGTKTEVKNLNSFRSVERAIDYEFKRQVAALEAGEALVQETRGWDESKQKTFSQRKKESSHDYRYFPDPDLPKLFLGQEAEFADLTATLPELPWLRRARLTGDFGLKSEDVEMYVADRELGDYVEAIAFALGNDKTLVQLASNYLTSDLAATRKLKADLVFPSVASFADLIKLISTKDISSRAAKDILALILSEGGEPKVIAEAKGWLQVHDESAVATIVEAVITEFPAVFAEFAGGKEASLQFLIGQGMKKGKGAANPELLKKLFSDRAGKGK